MGFRTIVASGSVLTIGFPQEFFVMGGTPAKIIKTLGESKFVPWQDEEEFYGFVPKKDFENLAIYKNYFSRLESFANDNLKKI